MALIVRNLRKAYGALEVLRGVDFAVEGGIVALMGANGAGKSTLLRILATLTRADSGSITFDGRTVGADDQALRRQIGYLPQEFLMPETLTPRKCLTYLAGLRGGNARALLDQFGLDKIADQPFGTLSGGQNRRVGIAQAFLGSPRLLLLDELTRGLDAFERQNVFRIIRQTKALTIFSTHVDSDAERIADQMMVLEAGRVVAM